MRYERKYLLQHISLTDIQQVINLHPAAFRLAFPSRKINNVYFDTANFSAYSDNVKGIAQRSKFRIRWYGEQGDFIRKPVLEEKIKRGELGYKNAQKVNDFDWKNLNQIAQEIPQITQQNLHPVLINSYLRHYYISFDNRFRITIDEQMEFAAFSLVNHPNKTENIFPENKVIEMKYEESDSPKADWISQYLPFRPTKHSKYVIGVDACF